MSFSVIFAAMALLVKLGGAHFEAIELGFYRSLAAFLFIAAFVIGLSLRHY